MQDTTQPDFGAAMQEGVRDHSRTHRLNAALEAHAAATGTEAVYAGDEITVHSTPSRIDPRMPRNRAEKRKQAHRVRAWVRGVNRAVKLQGDLRRVAVARGLERAEAHVDQIAAG